MEANALMMEALAGIHRGCVVWQWDIQKKKSLTSCQFVFEGDEMFRMKQFFFLGQNEVDIDWCSVNLISNGSQYRNIIHVKYF